MQRPMTKQLCYTGQRMPTVPTLLVCVVCVLSTMCLSAPVTKDLCQPLTTTFLGSHSYVTPL